jgi:hypothetical protein
MPMANIVQRQRAHGRSGDQSQHALCADAGRSWWRGSLRLRQGVVQLLKKLTEPMCLRHAVDHDVVLRLSTRMGNDVLMLR